MKKWYLTIGAIFISPLTLVSVVACSQDPVDRYLEQMATLLTKPEALVKVQIRPQYWLNQDPQQIDLSFNDLINNYQNVLEVVALKPWNDWNAMIENDQTLSAQAKRLLKLSKKSLTLVDLPKQFSQKIPESLNVKINLSNGRFSALIKTLKIDLRQINFVRQTTMVAQVENDYLKQFATTLGQKMIDDLQLKLEQVQADPTLLHFQAKPSDFELFNDPLWAQLANPHLNFYYDFSKPIDANPFTMIFYYGQNLITNQPIASQIKNNHFYLITDNVNCKLICNTFDNNVNFSKNSNFC